MNKTPIAALGLAALLAALSGCTEPQQPQRQSFLHNNPWTVKKPGEGRTGSNSVVTTPAGTPGMATTQDPTAGYLAAQAPGTAYKADTEIVSPIINCRGNWTVRLAFYNPDPQKKLTALYFANQHVRNLCKQGYDAYVTDLVSKAIVSVGSFENENDPKLLETWRQAYDDWMKIYGGRKSPFRESMEQFYGNKTVFGDQPWPVAVIDLQIKMKGAYHIPLTDDDKRRYKDYIGKRAKTGENP